MKFSSIVLLIGVIFVLTYNPKTGFLDRYIQSPPPSSVKTPSSIVTAGAVGTTDEEKKSTCCNSTDYRAENNVQCRAAYYQGLQFGDPDYGCPTKQPSTCQGAII